MNPSPQAEAPRQPAGAPHADALSAVDVDGPVEIKTASAKPVTPLADVMNLAARLQEQGELAAAAAVYQQWLAAGDGLHQHIAWFNLGTILSAMHQYQGAARAYQEALALDPGFSQANLNLGHQFEHLQQVEDALAQWQIVIDRHDNSSSSANREHYLHALNNSARLLEKERELERAEALMVRSIKCSATQPDVIQHYVHIRQKQCKWPVYQPVGELTHNQMLMATSALAMMGLSDDPAMQLLSAYRFVNDKVPPSKAGPLFNADRSITAGDRRIRIGYLSGDLCLHAMGLLIPELLELHDRNKFSVYGFCWSREDNTPERKRLVDAFDHFERVDDVDDLTAAKRIAAHEIDILVDLHGLSSGARPEILGHEPAPIQVGYLGLPATSAVPGVSHMIGDPYVMRPEYLPYCTERPIMVPHCYQVSDRRRAVGPQPTRAACELPETAFVYCSFNNNHKFTEEMFNSWMRILAAVPDSVLWLLADNQWSRANMQACAQRHGVASERLIFAPRVAPPEYRARFALADLFLDTFPYNAGATASDVLWMGTPLLTLSGRTYISRMAGSLLTSVGLPDLITHSPAEYEQRAIDLGINRARVQSYRRYLEQEGRRSRLFDVPALVADLESAFQALCVQLDGRRQEREAH